MSRPVVDEALQWLRDMLAEVGEVPPRPAAAAEGTMLQIADFVQHRAWSAGVDERAKIGGGVG